MQPSSHSFKANCHAALLDERLQQAMARAKHGFVDKRRAAVAALPEFESLRDVARGIKQHTLEHLDAYLLRFEAAVQAAGGSVHWARDAEEANRIIVEICRDAGAHSVIKGKSMVGEETAVNPALERAGFDVVETDLGEYIIQLAKEPPSHIIAPAVHKSRSDVAQLFASHHGADSAAADSDDPDVLLNEARRVLRARFLGGDVGITGANFLVAETGSIVLVTNEGNGDLSSTLPRTHIVIAGIEKVVPTLEDATTILRLLARSATGQTLTSYTTFVTGARREADADGPEAFHVVLVDNGRSEMLAGEFREMLRCIRCGACLNHCPVYSAVGGHAYGWVYPGPMGSVLTPLLVGLDEAQPLPNASTLCGRCESVCPMRIPLPRMLRALRERAHREHIAPLAQRLALRVWGAIAHRPAIYRAVASLAARAIALLARRDVAPPGAAGWTDYRRIPRSEGQTFMAQARRRLGDKLR